MLRLLLQRRIFFRKQRSGDKAKHHKQREDYWSGAEVDPRQDEACDLPCDERPAQCAKNLQMAAAGKCSEIPGQIRREELRGCDGQSEASVEMAVAIGGAADLEVDVVHRR